MNRAGIRKRIVAAWVVFVALSSWATTAVAQSGAATETTIHGGTLVLIAYITLWVIFAGVLFRTLRRQQLLQGELDGLESRIDEVLGMGRDEETSN